MRADEAKQNAQEVLLKTNATKEQVDKSNEDLRNLIKQIREFLMRKDDLLLIFTGFVPENHTSCS